jgi:CYTH domain-containing protein/thymidylate kinase
MNQSFGYDKNFSCIAVTGGPCAGKSTFMAKAKQYLENRGFRVAILSETATELINAGFPPWAPWKDSISFQKHVLQYAVDRENFYHQRLLELAEGKHTVLICDRGALDSRAYVSAQEFQEILRLLGVTAHQLRDRYKAIIHLVTAAIGAEDFYTLENNSARTETVEMAKALDVKTLAAWNGHDHLMVIDNSVGFDQKMTRALESLTRALGMPDPIERERKYVVENFSSEFIPKGSVKKEIEQTYLFSDRGEVERRVRKSTIDGESTFTTSTKVQTLKVGERINKKRLITENEYFELLSDKLPGKRTICKNQYWFEENGHGFKLDVYADRNLVILEVEVSDMDTPITLPSGFECVEVTGDPNYSNYTLADK